MSSALLYLAIFVVWAMVLVPMWLRRDTETTGISRLLGRRPVTIDEEFGSSPSSPSPSPSSNVPSSDVPSEEGLDDPVAPSRSRSRSRRGGRAAVIARRRRRTSGLLLLVIITVATVATGLGPWWVVLPPIGLLAGHLSLLRVAAGIDAARHHEALLARRAARVAPVDTPAEIDDSPQAEIIDLVFPGEVFDQYADLRAVGD
ncbi:MAG: hypothetical protein JWN00_5497 [Actinomycetia bacterium]|nr:hypothetical protein [Actinomycetes bacterium]